MMVIELFNSCTIVAKGLQRGCKVAVASCTGLYKSPATATTFTATNNLNF